MGDGHERAAGKSAEDATVAAAGPQTVVLTPIKDTDLWQAHADRGYGSCNWMAVNRESNDLESALIQFDLSSLPASCVINSATLSLTVVERSDRSHIFNADIHRMSRDWVEDPACDATASTGATWNQSQAGMSWTVAGGDFDASVIGFTSISDSAPVGTVYTWTVTSLVQDWYAGTVDNYGLALSSSALNQSNKWVSFYTREEPVTSNRPQLSVTFVCGGGVIDGQVWDDQNRDGVVDSGESGLANVDIALYAGTCSTMNFTPLQSQTTGSDGVYAFTALDAAPYCVRVDETTLPTAYGTTDNQNPRDVDFSQSFSPVVANFGYGPIYANDRLTVGAFAPCTDYGWLQSLASTHSATIVTVDTSACVFTLAGDAADLDALRTDLASHPTDRYDSPDVRDYGVYAPNDPDYNNATLVYAPQQINAPTAWDTTLGDATLILAVVDTGIDFAHPEFAGRIVSGFDFVNEDSDPTDDHGHGTHVAGIAAAGIDNALGMAGIAGQVKIMPIKVLNASNVGWMSDVAAGITFAVDNGARVINLSLAGTAESLAVRDAIDYAVSKGAVVLAAGGNDNSDVARYPAVYEKVIALGATSFDGSRWTLSNFGPNVDLMAPGATIWSARPGNSYAFMSGTSMAAPHAAGVAALMLSVNPNLTADQVKQALQETATDMGDPGYDSMYGYGQIDASAALGAVPAGVAAPPTTSLETALVVDINKNGLLDPGDTLAYTIVAANSDPTPLANVSISALVPAHTTYVVGSTELNGIPVLDAGSTPLPLDEGGLNIGSVPANNSSRVSFRVVVGTPPRGVYAILSTVEIQTELGSETLMAESEVAGTLVKASVDRSTARSGDTLAYTLTTEFVGGDLLQNVVITAPIPAGTSYAPDSANAGGSESGGVVTWTLGSNAPGVPGVTEGGGGPPAAITLNSTSSAATASSAVSLIWSHTIASGNNRILTVNVVMESGQSTTVTYGGIPLTLVGRQIGVKHIVEIWRLVAPPIGTANIVATFSGSIQVVGGAAAYNGVDPVTPTGTFQGTTGTAATASVDISSTPGEMVIDAMITDANCTVAPGAGQTQRWYRVNSGMDRLGTGSSEAGAASVTMSWTGACDDWTIAAVSLKPAAPGGDEGKITWSTFQGGGGSDNNNAVTVDSSGNVYGAGKSNATWGSPVRAYAGGDDALITKFDSNGTLLWHTFLGGNSGLVNDYANGVAVDSDGNVYVTGQSVATWGSPLRAFAGDWDTYVAKLNSSGTLLWHTFLGGTGYDNGNDIVLDGSGNVIVAGYSDTVGLSEEG